MALPRLQIIVASTRQGRKGPAVAAWFEREARAHGAFEVELVDLAEVNLPMLDEPEHPRLGQYQHDHTKSWSARVSTADAFVFVTPEYNYSAPPSLVNALDYLSREWAYKPVAFVSYGGPAGGTRSVQVAKQIVGALKMVALVEAVVLPFFQRSIDATTGVFAPDVTQTTAAKAVLTELRRWSDALAPLRR